MVGSNRVVLGHGIVHVTGDASLPADEEKALRRRLVHPDAADGPLEDALFAHDSLSIELEPHQQAELERTHQQVAAPAGKPVPVVERHSGGRDGRCPLVQRLGHALLVGPFADLRAATVVPAVGDHRPAIVHAGADDVDLVTTLRAVLVGPELAGPRIHRRSLHVAVAKSINLGSRAGHRPVGIVPWYAAVLGEAYDGAGVVAGVLRARSVAPVSQGEEYVPCAVEHHAPAEVAASPRLRQRPEQDLHSGKAVAVEPAAGELGAVAADALAGIGEVKEAVLREPWMQRHVVQPALPPRRQAFGKAGDGSGIQRAVGGNVAEPARPFGNKHPSVGEKCQRPRVFEPLRHNTDAHGVPLGLFDRVRVRGSGPAEDQDDDGGGEATPQKMTYPTVTDRQRHRSRPDSTMMRGRTWPEGSRRIPRPCLPISSDHALIRCPRAPRGPTPS